MHFFTINYINKDIFLMSNIYSSLTVSPLFDTAHTYNEKKMHF